LRYCYLDGGTKDRMKVVHAFNTEKDIPVFLISLKAGGTGLNLTGADMVIHYDPWWNPAVEDQATDRAHRIGQHRTVYNVKLIARDTVEEKVLAMQRRKQTVINATLAADEQPLEKLSWEDVRELLALE
jgi:SNF2 family DNA or RNA helicase